MDKIKLLKQWVLTFRNLNRKFHWITNCGTALAIELKIKVGDLTRPIQIQTRHELSYR